MATNKRYMVVHRDPNLKWTTVEENWKKLVGEETAIWRRTYFNKNEGIRYCIWLAPGEESLKRIFSENNISFESIVEIEETVADTWSMLTTQHSQIGI